ncbi:MAG: amino acid permease [Elusimicrobiota bacterium]
MNTGKKLKRDLKFVDIFSIAVGSMISSGLFVLPGLAYAKAGPAVILSYFLAACLAIPGMFSQAELVSAMPKAGGTYYYITRSLGPAVGTIDGIVTWLAITLKSSFALVGLAAFAQMLGPVNLKAVSLIFALAFIILNYTGAKSAGRAQTVLVSGLLLLLTFFIVRGIGTVRIENFADFSAKGVTGIISTAGFVFISYGGLLKVASIAEEAKNPSVNIPKGMIFSLIVVSVFYVLTVFVTTGVLEGSVLNNSLTPITDAAAVFMGEPGRIILAAAAVLAFISTANAGIMAASRYPMALSRDKMLPGILKKLNRYNVPVNSLLLTGIVIFISLFLELSVLVKAASTVMILSFIFACFSVIILRESHVQNYQPSFKTPLYPWLQIIGIVTLVTLLFKMGLPALLATLLFFIGGFLVYWFYGRERAEQEYALIHLIERIGDKKLTGGLLESELKSVIRERDDIIHDRFDRLIENCDILDYDRKVGMKEFLREASRKLSPDLNISSDELYEAFLKREAKTSTVLSSFLAIPHIVVEGENIFEILVARSKDGIEFETSEGTKTVNAAFVMVGSEDERNFHLKTLSAISQLVQNPDFTKMWMSERSNTNIRDIILLGERLRHESG